MSRKKLVGLAVLFSATACLSSAFPTHSAEQTIERQLENTNDWIVYLDVGVLKDFLSYATSQMESPAAVKVSYRRKGPNGWADSALFEELWYHQGAAVGLRRRFPMIPLQYFGTIYVRPSSLLMEQTKAVANAIIRLSLDIFLVNASLKFVVVPKEIYERLRMDLTSFGFRKFSSMPGGGHAKAVVVHLVSDPPAFEDYLYYNCGRSLEQ